MDALTSSNLKDTLRLKEKREETSEKDWDKINKMTCGFDKILFDTRHQVSCVVCLTSTLKIWEILEKKYLTKSIESRLHLKRKLYRF